MSHDLVDVARRRVEAMERGDIADPWTVQNWRPRLDELAGSDRTVGTVRQIGDAMVRVVFEGSRGQAFVSFLFDGAAEVFGCLIDSDERDGKFWVVVDSPPDQHDELRAFYTMLAAGMIGADEDLTRPPRWRDPTYPAQMHLDVLVADLDAAERAVLEHGATKLEDFPGWRVYADPVGHPFCLYPGLAERTDRPGMLVRVVIDCADPSVLARFWGVVLDMPRRVEESPDRIVIARDDASLPMLALQRVPDYRPPRWPDPDYPAQMHFDIFFDDRTQKERLVMDLGGTRLPPQGGSCPVYADPAGHPFCLCYKGE
jgi:hypothetical protein